MLRRQRQGSRAGFLAIAERLIMPDRHIDASARGCLVSEQEMRSRFLRYRARMGPAQTRVKDIVMPTAKQARQQFLNALTALEDALAPLRNSHAALGQARQEVDRLAGENAALRATIAELQVENARLQSREKALTSAQATLKQQSAALADQLGGTISVLRDALGSH